MQALTPHVYWAQRHGDIYLRVEISDAQVKPDELNASSLSSVAIHFIILPAVVRDVLHEVVLQLHRHN